MGMIGPLFAATFYQYNRKELVCDGRILFRKIMLTIGSRYSNSMLLLLSVLLCTVVQLHREIIFVIPSLVSEQRSSNFYD
jgi:hypothetical protein